MTRFVAVELAKDHWFDVSATHAATRAATHDATYAATRDATADATDAATRAATADATDAATADATQKDDWYAFGGAFDFASLARTFAPGNEAFAAECCKNAWRMYQGGNAWSGYESFLTFFRDVVNLPLDYSKYDPWVELAQRSGFRWMHPEFCIISDRPEVLTVDDQNRPHGESGPFCRWRDGSALYSWHGTRVPRSWIESKATLDPRLALTHDNVEMRRAVADIVGWRRVLGGLSPRILDTDGDPQIGSLLEVDLPDSPAARFLSVRCGTGRDFVLPVPQTVTTALEANAWTYGFDAKAALILRALEVRT
jgi:hypothetical protein